MESAPFEKTPCRVFFLLPLPGGRGCGSPGPPGIRNSREAGAGIPPAGNPVCVGRSTARPVCRAGRSFAGAAVPPAAPGLCRVACLSCRVPPCSFLRAPHLTVPGGSFAGSGLPDRYVSGPRGYLRLSSPFTALGADTAASGAVLWNYSTPVVEIFHRFLSIFGPNLVGILLLINVLMGISPSWRKV